MGKRQRQRQRIEELQLAVRQLKGDLKGVKRECGRACRALDVAMRARDGLSEQLKLAREAARKDDGGWERIAERQRIYIRALEERLAGTWDPAATHQKEYDLYYGSKASH
jgi:hypothetical protein